MSADDKGFYPYSSNRNSDSTTSKNNTTNTERPPNLRHRRGTGGPRNDYGRSKTTSSSAHPRSSSSKRRSWKQKLLLIVSTLAAFGIWYFTPLSELVVQALLYVVPLEADLALGRAALQQDEELALHTYFDQYWTPKLQQIGSVLVQSAEVSSLLPQSLSSPYSARDYHWDFGVLRSSVVNAFCLPGGLVRVTSALLKELALTDGELAALLGHEMGHVLYRHAQGRILSQRIVSTILQALVYHDDDDHEESLGEAIGELLLKSADWLGRQSFSRSNEYQADATSWELLVSRENQYHPKALTSLLEKLWAYHGNQGGTTSWDSTHPGTLDRIEALEAKWKALSRKEQRQLNQRNKIR